MSTRQKDEQFEVYSTLQDLRAFAVPEEDWSRLERANGAVVQWPAAVAGATDNLTFSPKGLLYSQEATLVMEFAEGGHTLIGFERNIGKITTVSRYAGELTVLGMLKTELKARTFGKRPRPADYDVLVRELRAGIAHFGDKRYADD